MHCSYVFLALTHRYICPTNSSISVTAPGRAGLAGRVWASYQICKIAVCACAGNAGNVFPCRRFRRKPLVSNPSMHHGTCVTHVPWCMSGSLTCGDGENIPGICAHATLRIWQETHCVRCSAMGGDVLWKQCDYSAVHGWGLLSPFPPYPYLFKISKIIKNRFYLIPLS